MKGCAAVDPVRVVAAALFREPELLKGNTSSGLAHTL